MARIIQRYGLAGLPSGKNLIIDISAIKARAAPAKRDGRNWMPEIAPC